MPEQIKVPSTVISSDSAIEPGPSGFHDTEKPYLARILNIPQDIISSLNLWLDIKEVDSFILDLIKERQWKDDKQSYQDILDELQLNLNIHKNLDYISLIERLTEGVKLLKLQRMHKRREGEIQKQINKLKL